MLALGIVLVEVGVRRAQPATTTARVHIQRAAPVLASIRDAPVLELGSTQQAALVTGVAFGRTDLIDESTQQEFRDSGLSHLLAASGQNIALVIGLVLALTLVTGGNRVHGALASLFAIPLYVLVVGGGPSIVRAGIMGELAVLGWLLGRGRDMWHLLVVSAALIVWIWPGAHRSLGFQLSYACVAGLLLWAQPTCSRLIEAGVPRAIALAASATLVCSLVTAPLLYLAIGTVPATGAVTNLVAVPIAAAIMLLGVVGSVLDCVASNAGTIPLQIAGWLAGLLGTIAATGARFPGAQTSSAVIAVGVPAALGGAWYVRRRGTRAMMIVSVCTLTIAGSASTVTTKVAALPPTADGNARFAVLDVGQGDATLVTSEKESILVDVGPPDSGVVRAARIAGSGTVDGIVLTHDSRDHRGALQTAVEKLRPRWIAFPRNAAGEWGWVRQLGPRNVELCARDRFRVGRVDVDVLHPACDGSMLTVTSDAHNDNALVLRLVHGSVRVLLSADAEGLVTATLHPGQLTMLRVGHHGSFDAGLDRLLAVTHPQVATISVGSDNAYGHPHAATIGTLHDAGVTVFRTDRDGTVAFDSNGRSLQLVE
jgi:competence protein ComEC